MTRRGRSSSPPRRHRQPVEQDVEGSHRREDPRRPRQQAPRHEQQRRQVHESSRRHDPLLTPEIAERQVVDGVLVRKPMEGANQQRVDHRPSGAARGQVRHERQDDTQAAQGQEGEPTQHAASRGAGRAGAPDRHGDDDHDRRRGAVGAVVLLERDAGADSHSGGDQLRGGRTSRPRELQRHRHHHAQGGDGRVERKRPRRERPQEKRDEERHHRERPRSPARGPHDPERGPDGEQVRHGDRDARQQHGRTEGLEERGVHQPDARSDEHVEVAVRNLPVGDRERLAEDVALVAEQEAATEHDRRTDENDERRRRRHEEIPASAGARVTRHRPPPCAPGPAIRGIPNRCVASLRTRS